MIYYEFDFKKFYFPFQRTENGWVFGFIRKVVEKEEKRKYNFLIDDILKELQDDELRVIPDENIQQKPL